MVLTQISFIFMLLMLRLRRDEIYRLPLNSLIFFLVCLVSGLIYYAIGGTHDYSTVVQPANLWMIIVYLFSYYILNTIFVLTARYFLINQKPQFFTKDAIWDLASSLIVLPIGIILFDLYQQLGYLAILFGGVPLIGIAFVMRLYNSSQEINRRLRKASEIGHQLTQRLQVEEVLHLFVEKISAILPSEQTYIFDVFNKENKIHLLRYAEQGIEKEKEIQPFPINAGICGFVRITKQGIIYNSKKEWKHLDRGGFLPKTTQSVLAVPIVRNSLVVGVLILASEKKRAYEQYQLMIMNILCSYLGVAIENARHVEETKKQSERCALTNLYNYRYFESAIEEEFNKEYSHLSLILLDIDHFKSINDTYGHQAGNEILIELARSLELLISNKGVLARYGGEEFVILLSKVDKAEAYDFAEFIRKSIEIQPFSVHSDLDELRSKILIPITASIGVASAPDDAEDAQTLIRHADRAMYTGAKQAGRNKVAEYVG
ncbi:sensor domain-containing diguanylate cyclase [Bacillus sp. V59.32b]|uniref:sensor domain-containing diguanylate cyclase n=1 Tax=Bacillus sp. V59.32b TaxID=1758642 RepID=UPI0020B10801|nr:sensor domain-containing diguanylate cyclase [Bacillus sp. V59.32b]